MIGEKHINPSDLGQCASHPELPTAYPYSGKFAIDCSYIGNQHTSAGAVAGLTLSHNANSTGLSLQQTASTPNLSYPIMRSTDPTWPYNYGGAAWVYSYFGSPHVGICNFVLGDGSVQSLSSSTATNIFGCLGTVSDGNSVAIP